MRRPRSSAGVVTALVVGVGCSSLPTHRWVYDDARACFVYQDEGLVGATWPDADCPVAEQPAVTAAGACVVLPVACLPSGYGPAAAAPACAAAWTVWDGDDPLCPDSPVPGDPGT